MPQPPDPPNPRLVRPVTWRWSGDGSHVLAFYPTHQRWVRQQPWTGAVLEGLEAREGYPQLVQRVEARVPALSASRARRVVRQHLFNLHRLGHVAMDLPAPPALFHDRYETVKELGRGGIGVATLCRDRTTGAPVVVKHAWDYFTTLARADAYMRQEAATMRALDHPGIVAFVDAFERGDLLHLVRGFAPGRDLTMTGRLEGSELVRVARGVAEVVQHLHDRGYLLIDHRPANFVRSGPTARPVLIDVGVCARHEGGAVRLDRRVGSRGFTAPEVLADGTAMVATDVWGYGRLLFYLATGVLPQGAWDEDEVAKRLGDHALRPLITASVATRPEARPATMRDVLERLTSA